MDARYYSISSSSSLLLHQRRQSFNFQSNISSRSSIQTDRPKTYGFNYHHMNDSMSNSTRLNDYSQPLNSYYHTRINQKPYFDQKLNPFVIAKPIRYYEKQTNNSYTGMSSWQKYKYLNKLKQSQLQHNQIPNYSTTIKIQQRVPIIRSSKITKEDKDEVDFTTINQNDLTSAKINDTKIKKIQQTNIKEVTKQDLNISFTKSIYIAQNLTKQSKEQIQYHKKQSKQPKQPKSLPIIHQQQLNPLQKVVKTQSKIQMQLSQSQSPEPQKRKLQRKASQMKALQPAKIKNLNSILFTKSQKKVNGKNYPLNIIYKNTAYQFINLA